MAKPNITFTLILINRPKLNAPKPIIRQLNELP